ncbi:MAG: hypothetical protein IT497_02435 [Ottowia sp.]|nr:hypothetical protein [Ottowia sp.]
MIVKIPACYDGLKAMAILSRDGISTLATTIYDSKQVVCSAIAGAKYAAPYLGRLLGDQNAKLADMQAVITEQKYPIKIMAAAIRSCEQFVECARLGVAAITLPVDVYQALFVPSSEVMDSLHNFELDWSSNPLAKQSDLFAH